MSHPTRQHYVPRMLLREFADPETGLVSVYDKHEDNTFQARPTRIAVENEFYDIEISDSLTVSTEESLSEIEGSAAEVLNKIRSEESIAWLSVEDRALISLFVAVQSLRVPHARQTLLRISDLMEQSFERWGIAPGDVENWRDMESEDAKWVTMEMMSDAAPDLAQYILEKLWILERTTEDKPFYISDNPVTLHNSRDSGPRSNLGFASEGIQIHLPISRTLSLLMLCPSYGRELQAKLDKVWRVMNAKPGSSVAYWDDVVKVTRLDNVLREGIPSDMKPINVQHNNSLQVKHGSRWIYSPSPDFGLVRKMIEDDEAFRTGPLMQVMMPGDLAAEGDSFDADGD